jgi:hypothetical protein
MDAWRIRAIERNVSRGLQDPRDLEAVIRHGFATRPACNGLCSSRCLVCFPPRESKPRKFSHTAEEI